MITPENFEKRYIKKDTTKENDIQKNPHIKKCSRIEIGVRFEELSDKKSLDFLASNLPKNTQDIDVFRFSADIHRFRDKEQCGEYQEICSKTIFPDLISLKSNHGWISGLKVGSATNGTKVIDWGNSVQFETFTDAEIYYKNKAAPYDVIRKKHETQ